jgi:hypothetical protein
LLLVVEYEADVVYRMDYLTNVLGLDKKEAAALLAR